MHSSRAFRQELKQGYAHFLADCAKRFPSAETMRVDLHCHDRNSDITDELWGRILRVPETWLETRDLVQRLRHHGADVLTITNHNNARSCWDLMDKGEDVLSGSEFTCTFKECDIQIHLLAYGFTPEQEEKLKVLRKDIYQFMTYAVANDIPTVQPHPLYFYNPLKRPPLEIFEKFALLFERFEVLNGQRDVWQNQLTAAWLEDMTPEKLEAWGKKHGISPGEFCRDPYRKRMTGGSDCHMGLFAGSCGTLFHIPDLATKRQTMKGSELILEALRHGEMAPYGHLAEEEKLNVAFLDYFSQLALNMDDPGLVRMFLHRGSLRDKLFCLAISNGFQELRRHRYTMRFFRTFHEALHGKRPGKLVSWAVARDYKPMLAQIDHIARAGKGTPEGYLKALRTHMPAINRALTGLLVNRIGKRLEKRRQQGQLFPDYSGHTDALVRRFEVPSHLRNLFGGDGPSRSKRNNMSTLNVAEWLDGLSFPFLASLVMVGSSLTSSKVLYNNRTFLQQFAAKLNRHRHPERVLWLTDTLFDDNGIAVSLQSLLAKIRAEDLPIDVLICDRERPPENHLHVLRPVAEFPLADLGGQMIRIPDLLEIQTLFREGGYDRVVCSTELSMGLVALFLKAAFSIPVHLVMHRDWRDYFAHHSHLDHQAHDRVRRVLRAFYKRFDGLFVFHREHHTWLTSPAMGIKPERVHLTLPWVDGRFQPSNAGKAAVFSGLGAEDPVLLFPGSLDEAHGGEALAGIVALIRENLPQTQIVCLGTGAAESSLRASLPDALFLGSCDAEQRARCFAAADIALFPSRLAAIRQGILEALACGCPVAAFEGKGAEDIVQHGISGLLCKDAETLAKQTSAFLANTAMRQVLRRGAVQRAEEFRVEHILPVILRDLGFTCAQKDDRPMLFRLRAALPGGEVAASASGTPAAPDNFFAELLDIVS